MIPDPVMPPELDGFVENAGGMLPGARNASPPDDAGRCSGRPRRSGTELADAVMATRKIQPDRAGRARSGFRSAGSAPQKCQDAGIQAPDIPALLSEQQITVVFEISSHDGCFFDIRASVDNGSLPG